MPSWLDQAGFGPVFAFLFVVVLCRAQATYWLGRAVAAGALRTRWSAPLTGPRAIRAAEALRRWGWPVIPVSFLTIGFQSAVNGAAGLIRMPWPRYTAAMLPGCVLWAAIYAVGGLAAFQALVPLVAQKPGAWAMAVVVAAVAGVVAAARRRRSLSASARRRTGSPPGLTAPPS